MKTGICDIPCVDRHDQWGPSNGSGKVILKMLNFVKYIGSSQSTTVDGSEILRSPVEVGSLSHYLQGFTKIPGGCLGFLTPSTVSTFSTSL